MATMVLFKRQSVKAPRMGKNQIADALKTINKRARVKRDTLVTFMLDGSFNKLPVTPQSVIDSPIRRENEGKGWEIPASEFGRVGVATPSSTESVRLWIKQNLESFGIDPDAVSVVFIADDGES